MKASPTTPFTWNGERIDVSDLAWPYGFDATLANYDPTPWDADTPARGPHATLGCGDSRMQAVADLVQQLWGAA